MKRQRSGLVVTLTKKERHTEIEYDVNCIGESDYVVRFHRPSYPQTKGHLIADLVLTVSSNDEIVFSALLYDTKKPHDAVSLLDMDYVSFETHTVSFVRESDDARAIYFQLRMAYKAGEQPKLVPTIDMCLSWFATNFGNRYKALSFFPPDFRPADVGMTIDASKVPPRSVLWFKSRGDVTGRKACILLGFNVPKTGKWSYDDEPVYDDASKARMWFGSDAEERAIAAYMVANPQMMLAMVGWCASHQYSGWGSTPDALITDDTMSWNDIDESITQYIDDKSIYDPRLGVLEVKSSQKLLSFDASYIPQIYMEMISTGRVWCDLMRYMENTTSHGTTYHARIYRVHRHLPTERLLIKLIKYALANKDRLQEIVHTDKRFIKARAYFADVAEQLHYRNVEVDANTMKHYQEYKQSVQFL